MKCAISRDVSRYITRYRDIAIRLAISSVLGYFNKKKL